MLTALPNLQRHLCAGAVAVSTFVSDYYLRFHGHGTRGQAVALDEIETVLPHAGVTQQGVGYLMLVLNANDHGGQQLINNDGHDFSSIVATHGYRLVALEPKYRDPEEGEPRILTEFLAVGSLIGSGFATAYRATLVTEPWPDLPDPG